VYEELEARVEETVRDALYGESTAKRMSAEGSSSGGSSSSELLLRYFKHAWQMPLVLPYQCSQCSSITICLEVAVTLTSSANSPSACIPDADSALHCMPHVIPHTAEARSVVVTQPNNKLSRILKALLKEVPAQLAAINAASMAASLAMADVNLAAIGAPGAAEAAKERLQQRLQLIQALQVGQ
jgi:hypothetical protein